MGLSESRTYVQNTKTVQPVQVSGSIFANYEMAVGSGQNRFQTFQQLVKQMPAQNHDETKIDKGVRWTIMQVIASDDRLTADEVLDFLSLLSQLGYNINCGGERPNDTIMNIVISRGKFDLAIDILKTFISIISVEKADGNGWTALHALLSRHTDVASDDATYQLILAKMLIFYGVPVNYPDYTHRRTALFYGLRANNAEIIKLLFDFSPSFRAGVNFMDVQGFTPLMLALNWHVAKPETALELARLLCENSAVYVNATNGTFTVMDCLDTWYTANNGKSVREYLRSKGAVNKVHLKDLAYTISDSNKLGEIDKDFYNLQTNPEPTRVITPARPDRPKANQEKQAQPYFPVQGIIPGGGGMLGGEPPQRLKMDERTPIKPPKRQRV